MFTGFSSLSFVLLVVSLWLIVILLYIFSCIFTSFFLVLLILFYLQFKLSQKKVTHSLNFYFDLIILNLCLMSRIFMSHLFNSLYFKLHLFIFYIVHYWYCWWWRENDELLSLVIIKTWSMKWKVPSLSFLFSFFIFYFSFYDRILLEWQVRDKDHLNEYICTSATGTWGMPYQNITGKSMEMIGI